MNLIATANRLSRAALLDLRAALNINRQERKHA